MNINDILVAEYSGYEIVGKVIEIEFYCVRVEVITCTEICNGRPASMMLPGETTALKPSEIILNKTSMKKTIAGLEMV